MTEVDRGRVLPLYVQVAALLRREISQRRYGESGALPSEAQLQQRFGISRVTARQALRRLADQGLVERRQGKGTYVAGQPLRHDLGQVRGFYDDLVCQGVAPQTELLFFGPPASGAPDGALPTRLERLYRVDGEPMALVRAWLPPAASALGRDAAERMTIYGLVEDGLGRRIARAESTVGAQAPDAVAAARLGVPGGGFVLTLARRSYDELGDLCESALFLVRPERYEFMLRSEGRAPGPNMRIRPAT